MDVLRTVSRGYLRLLVVVSAALISTTAATFAEQAPRHLQAADFVLSTYEGTLSLKATNASLEAILEQIGEELNIHVDAQVADGDTVTDKFHGLPLDQALRRLAPSYAIISDQEGGKITKIVIFPEGETIPTVPPEKQESKPNTDRDAGIPEPFKFEFDPSKLLQRER